MIRELSKFLLEQPLYQPIHYCQTQIPMSNSNIKDYIQSILLQADIQVNGNRPWDIQVHNEKFYQRIIKHGSLGLGEAYMDGWWDCPQLDEFFARIFSAKLHEHKVSQNLGYFLAIAQAKLKNLQSFSRAFQDCIF